MPWNSLPDRMRTEAVRPYYDRLARRRGSLVCKRVFDFVLSLLLLAVLWPLLVVIALAVALDSPGGAFFRQRRLTAYAKEFRIFKFRTMVSDADRAHLQVTLPDDTRITRVGRVLRRWKLDELPQLLNIVTGDMSFVGTRPEVPRYVDRYTDEMMATLLLPAGVTSEGSIFSIGEHELMAGEPNLNQAYVDKVLPVKMRYDLASLRHFTFLYELRTMVRTVLAVVGADIRADEYHAPGEKKPVSKA